jgi:transmembrane sensor
MKTDSFFRKDYSDYSVGDFLADEDFVTWVKDGEEDEELSLHWNAVIENLHEKSSMIKKAMELVRILSSQEVTGNYDRKQKIWNIIQDRTDESRTGQVINLARQLITRYRNIAAVFITIVLLAGAGWTGFSIRSAMIKSDENVFTTIYSPAGQKTEVTLPDKSRVWLNSKSTIRYSSSFNIKNRNIYLDGEAFFDVAKKSIPFEVKTSAINIKVLGTAFNVKCYNDEDIVEATLVRGSMKIEKINYATGLSEEILLKPNQKVQFLREYSGKPDKDKVISEAPTVKEAENTPLEQVKQVSFINSYETEKSSGWKDGLLIIEGESLGTLSKKLERRYDVKFVFTDEELKKFKYSGTLREYSLEQVLNALKMTSPINYRVDKQVVYIDKNEKANSDFIKLTNK